MTVEIRFTDGAAYEQYMGAWSKLVGDAFIDWLRPMPNLQWLDVGCGNGAFTERILQQCAPISVDGVDPSKEQLAFARAQQHLERARFHHGDAMVLPFENARFDVAVMPLVIFFVPVPATGVAEMQRVVRPGGTVCAYGWDLLGGGFPYAALQDEMRKLGHDIPMPPSPDAAGYEKLTALWTEAGLEDVELTTIVVQRRFESFTEYWNTILGGPSIKARLSTMPTSMVAQLEAIMRDRLQTDSRGGISYSATANAVRGRVGNARLQ